MGLNFALITFDGSRMLTLVGHVVPMSPCLGDKERSETDSHGSDQLLLFFGGSRKPHVGAGGAFGFKGARPRPRNNPYISQNISLQNDSIQKSSNYSKKDSFSEGSNIEKIANDRANHTNEMTPEDGRTVRDSSRTQRRPPLWRPQSSAVPQGQRKNTLPAMRVTGCLLDPKKVGKIVVFFFGWRFCDFAVCISWSSCFVAAGKKHPGKWG